MLNLDTHVLVHALSGSLTERERELLANDTWSVSAIVLWEICKLVELGQLQLELDDSEVERSLHRIHTWPLSFEVCRVSCQLGLPGDPADQIIAATSVVHNIPLVTRDRSLRRSKLVPLAAGR